MEMGEGMAMLTAIVDEDVKCLYQPDNGKGWTANLSGSGEALAANLGDKPNADSETDLSATNWPSQAHHLIPHKTLKRHKLSHWLQKGDRLFAHTYYNVDHENNGKWMPYASGLREWVTRASSGADLKNNRKLMFKVMEMAQIQLHQGPHSDSDRYGVGEAPYKGRVMEYLDKIQDNALSHYAGDHACSDCSSKKQGGKYPPRGNTVQFVDKASECIELDINKCRIFVSRIAAEFAEAGGFGEIGDA